MKKFLMIICAAVIFMAGCSNEPPVAVTTEKVLSGDSALTLTHEGTIALSEAREIFPPISGNILESYFEDGSEVTEGQKLFKIGKQQDSAELLQEKVALAELMTTLTKEIAEAAQAEKNSSAQERADKKVAIEKLQAEIAESQDRVKAMEVAAEKGMIYAPKSGRLKTIVATPGMTVTADETILATIGNANPVAVNFEISQTEQEILSASDSLKISLKFSDGTLYSHEGVIKIFDDTAEVFFENPDERLIIGTTAQIEFSGVKISNALLVPEKAIQKNGVENFAYIDDNKKAAVKKILLGDKVGTYFIVKDGLKADDYVIIDESFKNLREGTPLDVTNAK